MDATLLGQSPPYTYPNPRRYFIFNFMIISFIFIKNKCLSDVIWDLKREKKVRQKVGSNSGQSRQNARALSSTPLKLMWNEGLFSVLAIPITRWWAHLV